MAFLGKNGNGKLRPRAVDLNLVPPEFKGVAIPRRTTYVFLAALVALALLYPLRLAKSGGQANIASIQKDISDVQKSTALIDAAKAQVDQLNAAIKTQQDKLAEIDKARAALRLGLSWANAVNTIDSSRPVEVSLTSIVQSGTKVSVVGSATDYAPAVDFSTRLTASGMFTSVDFEQLVITPPGSATPVAGTSGRGVTFVMALQIRAGGTK